MKPASRHAATIAFTLVATLGFALSPLRAQTFDPAPGTWINTPFVITNDTGAYNDSQIFIAFNFGIGMTPTPQTYGTNTFGDPGKLQYGPFGAVNFQSAPLSDFLGTYNGASAYTFSLNNFTGRIYVSYGAALTGVPLSTETTPYLVFEPYIVGQVNQIVTPVPPPPPAVPAPPFIPATANNIDLSYVDGVSAAASTYIRANSGAILAATTNNPITTNPDILSKVAAAVPAAALVLNGSGAVVRVLSGSNAPAGTYHDWNALMTYAEGLATPLKIGSYTAPDDPTDLNQYGLTNALFGYNSTAPIAGQGQNFENGQGYAATATFDSAGVTISGTGIQNPGGPAATGAFTITITTAALNANTGVYGENPPYTVTTSSGTYTTTGIVNDLGGRVVGDLLAGMVFGWAGSDITNITAYAATTGLNLYGVTFSSNAVSGLSTGEYFYLMSLAAAQGLVTEWTGGGIATNPNYYDIYNYAIAQETGAYGSGFGDRFQGIYSPSTTWYTSYAPANPRSTTTPPANFENVGYVELQLLPVPEPSALALLLAGGAFAWLVIRRRNGARPGTHS